jgi:hypothetical protein
MNNARSLRAFDSFSPADNFVSVAQTQLIYQSRRNIGVARRAGKVGF